MDVTVQVLEVRQFRRGRAGFWRYSDNTGGRWSDPLNCRLGPLSGRLGPFSRRGGPWVVFTFKRLRHDANDDEPAEDQPDDDKDDLPVITEVLLGKFPID